jgi:phosphate transport system protein
LVQDAVKGLLNADVSLARQIITRDQEVDKAENSITREAIRLLATNQPVARDLRFLSSVFRLVTDLERVADLAVNLAWRTVAINEEIALRASFSPLLIEMTLMVKKMMAQALEALGRRNDEAALVISHSDHELNNLHHRHRRAVVAIMQQQPELIPWGVEVILANNYLERIGDHITNLGEDIFYLVRGQVIRHQDSMKSEESEAGQVFSPDIA